MWILMVSSEVELLFPIDHAAPGSSAELLDVFLVQLSSLWIQGSCRVDLVEDTSGVEKALLALDNTTLVQVLAKVLTLQYRLLRRLVPS